MPEEYVQIRDVVVLGLGLSGCSVLRFLHRENLVTRCFDDDKSKEELAIDLGSLWMKPADGLLSNAVLLVVSPGIASDHPVIMEAQALEIEIINDIELFARMHKNARIIGITGTNGKSTLTSLTCHILNELGIKAEATGNYGVPVFDVEMEENPLLVLELSSYQLERCPSLQTEISVLINLTPDHLERYENSLDCYVATKLNILKALQSGGVMIMGSTLREHPVVRHRLDKELDERKKDVLQFFVDEPALYNGIYNIALDENERILVDDRFPLTGKAGAELISLALSIVATIEPSFFTAIVTNKQRLVDMIERFQPIAHRQEKFAEIGHVACIDDSKATNPESSAVAIERYRNIFWIAGGKDKHTSITAVFPYLDNVEAVYLIGEARERLERLLRRHSDRLKINVCACLEEASVQALEQALSYSKHGTPSTVLLSPMCSSFDQFPNFTERGEKFKGYIRHMLATHSA